MINLLFVILYYKSALRTKLELTKKRCLKKFYLLLGKVYIYYVYFIARYLYLYTNVHNNRLIKS